MSVLKKVIH